MTCASPMTVDGRAVSGGDRVSTDPDTAAGLIAHRFAVPNNTDQEVD